MIAEGSIQPASTGLPAENRLSFQKAAGHQGQESLPRSRTAKKNGIPVWPTASKLLALAVSDSFRRN